MLIEFSFGNFRSFRDLTTLSMVAARISSKYDELDTENIFSIDSKLNLLKSKAIYGQNASGKSNIIKALVTFLRITRYSVKSDDIIVKMIEPFKLNKTSLNEPTFFQIVFRPKDETATYRYGFEIKAGKILTEWLFVKDGREEVPFFTREDMSVEVRNRYKEAKKYEGLSLKDDSEIFRDNSLFLTAVAALGGVFSKKVIKILSEIIVISSLSDPLSKIALKEALEDNDKKKTILELTRAADFDLENIESDSDDISFSDDIPDELRSMIQSGQIKKTPKFITERAVLDENGKKVDSTKNDFETWESEGTKKFIFQSPFLIDTLNSGGVFVIDEFDARLHPNLTKKIVRIFNSNRTNPKNAQLIFVTHNTNLLSANLLRRDQICFVDKDAASVSSSRTLVEFKGVRNDASFEKAYLNGEYGAIPFLNRFEQIFEN